MYSVPSELEQVWFNKVVVSHGFGFGSVLLVDEDRYHYVFELKTGEGEESFLM